MLKIKKFPSLWEREKSRPRPKSVTIVFRDNANTVYTQQTIAYNVTEAPLALSPRIVMIFKENRIPRIGSIGRVDASYRIRLLVIG